MSQTLILISQFEIISRLILATLLGGLIGWEREMHARPAGFRTHILVSVGSTLFMLVSLYIHHLYLEADPARIASSIVSGIGFLGAGTIIREGVSVKGLTTAASLWTVSGIGMAVGGGFYFSALVTTTIVFIVLFFLNTWEQNWNQKKRHHTLLVEIRDRPGLLDSMDTLFQLYRLTIDNVHMVARDGVKMASIQLKAPPGIQRNRVTEDLMRVEGMVQLKWDYE